MQNDDKFVGFFGILAVVGHIAAWLGSGYLAWNWIGVNSFVSAIGWLFAWAVFGGIAHFAIGFIVSLLVLAADDVMGRDHSGDLKTLKSSAPDNSSRYLMQSKIDEIAQGDEQLKAKITDMMSSVGHELDAARNRFLNNDYQPLPFWSIHGRMRRRTYALWLIPTVIVWIVLQIGAKGAVSGLSVENFTFTNLLIPSLIAFIPVIFMLFLGVKRLHDCNRKGWWLLIPFVNLMILFPKGTCGNNRFGADPRPENADWNDDDDFESDYSFWWVTIISFAVMVSQIQVAVKDVQRAIQAQQNHAVTTATATRPADTFRQPEHTHTPPAYQQPQPQIFQVAPTAPPPTTDVQHGGLLGRVLTLSQNAHVRDCPNNQCKSFGVIPLGSRVIVVQNAADGMFASGNWLYINYEGNFCYQYSGHQNTCHNYAQARVAGWLHIGALSGNYGVPQPTNTSAAATPNTPSYTDMMRFYNQPDTAPAIAECKGNTLCNAFVALAKQWQAIPSNYRYKGFDIRQQAAQGDGYGLNKGFTLQAAQSIALSEAAEPVFYAGGGKSKAQERIFAQGLAVLLYLEDQNGWAR